MARNISGLKRDAGPGRPKGSKDRVPRSAKRAVELLIEQFGADPTLLQQAIEKGLKADPPASFNYVRMIVEQAAGAPDQTVKHLIPDIVHEHIHS